MSRYRMLAIDVDGTLVNSRDELTGVVCDALRRVADAGIHLVVATGRRYSRTLHLVEPLGIEVPLVTGNGSLVKNPIDHETLHIASFERADLCAILRVVRESGFEPILNIDGYEEGFDYYCETLEVDSPQLAEYYDLNENCGRLWPNIASDPPPGVFGGFTMGTHQEMLDLEATLHAALPGKVETGVLRSPRYVGYMCEFAPQGVTKWSAIRWLADRWEIEASAICAVGDDVNDIEMIRESGLGIAMGNALPSVKAAADRVAPSHDEDGVVTVAQWLLGG